MVKTVTIRDVYPGDILAEKVTAPSGIVLLPAGVKLTRAHLDKIKSFGIQYVVIN